MKKDYNYIMDTLVGVSENLLQVAVYTTTAPRCVIILDRDPANLLESMEPVREYVSKRHLPFPLLVNKEFIRNSLDTFPLEFLDIIGSDYSNLMAKEDVLKEIRFTLSDLRLQMERELKSKWLLTRLTVLERTPKPRELADVLVMSIHSIIPILKGFCYLNDTEIPADFSALISTVTKITQIDLSFLMHWEQLSKADVFIIKNYLDILQKMMDLLENGA